MTGWHDDWMMDDCRESDILNNEVINRRSSFQLMSQHDSKIDFSLQAKYWLLNIGTAFTHTHTHTHTQNHNIKRPSSTGSGLYWWLQQRDFWVHFVNYWKNKIAVGTNECNYFVFFYYSFIYIYKYIFFLHVFILLKKILLLFFKWLFLFIYIFYFFIILFKKNLIILFKILIIYFYGPFLKQPPCGMFLHASYTHVHTGTHTHTHTYTHVHTHIHTQTWNE